MFTEPVVRAYAAHQRRAMVIEPWSLRTRHPSGVQCVEVARSRYDAQVITLHPAGVRHWKRRLYKHATPGGVVPRRQIGFAIPSGWRL